MLYIQGQVKGDMGGKGITEGIKRKNQITVNSVPEFWGAIPLHTSESGLNLVTYKYNYYALASNEICK